MTPYRQPILPGDVGSDVKAAKRAMEKMGAKGANALVINETAGDTFQNVLNGILLAHGYGADSTYGPGAHAIIAPHFDAYGAMLYRRAALRHHAPPPPPTSDAAHYAAKLLDYHRSGHYRDDRGTELVQIQAAAAGKPVWSRGGYYVHIDWRVFAMLCWLIEDGYTIGTFALCSDHGYDSPNGHGGGKATDISSINGVSIGGRGAHDLTLAVAEKLHAVGGAIHPRQLICGGSGGSRDAAISACSLPGADWYYTKAVMQEHTNHIHGGV